jgi:hypothetical protein
MTHTYPTRIVTLLAWIAASAALVAQSGSITYNPTEEAVVSGTILHVVSLQGPDGYGVHFDLKTKSGLMNVHVSPAAYFGEKNVFFYADEEVELTGVKQFIDGNKSFLVRTIKKTADGKTLELRDAEGKPRWTPATNGTDGCGVAHPALPRGTEL